MVNGLACTSIVWAFVAMNSTASCAVGPPSVLAVTVAADSGDVDIPYEQIVRGNLIYEREQ